MIKYTCLMRITDGLPMCATNISLSNEQYIQDGKKAIKLIGKKAMTFPNRACIQGDELTIHCFKDADSILCALICEPNYPHILAYSYLDELMKEFSLLYIPSVINAVKRPYSFIEFESYLVKLQEKYNHGLAARINLPELMSDFNLNPPKYMKLADMYPPPEKMNKGFVHNGSATINITNGPQLAPSNHYGSSGIKLKLKPMSWYGRVGLVLGTVCIMLDLYRGGVSLSTSLEDDDGPTISHGASFIFEMILLLIQCYYMKNYSRYRKLITSISFLCIIFLNVVVLSDVREILITFLYIFSSLVLGLSTFQRKFEKCTVKPIV